jgi:hypothetical protein
VGLAGDLVIDAASCPRSSSEPPCITVADRVTAEPANIAARTRAAGCHKPGDTDELAAIATSTLHFTVHSDGFPNPSLFVGETVPCAIG